MAWDIRNTAASADEEATSSLLLTKVLAVEKFSSFKLPICFAYISDVTLAKVLKNNPTRLVKAAIGENSHVHKLVGDPAADYKISVPVGVTVYSQTGVKLGELNAEDDRVVVAKGGVGGRPVTQFNGLKGEELKIVLDLKLIADVGLVGFPNGLIEITSSFVDFQIEFTRSYNFCKLILQLESPPCSKPFLEPSPKLRNIHVIRSETHISNFFASHPTFHVWKCSHNTATADRHRNVR